MTRTQVLDLYFLEARHRLLDVAAFLDRLDRAEGAADYRLPALERALAELVRAGPDRAERALIALSDPTTDPIPRAPGQGAAGAYDPALVPANAEALDQRR